jgi:hypothetical protein
MVRRSWHVRRSSSSWAGAWARRRAGALVLVSDVWGRRLLQDAVAATRRADKTLISQLTRVMNADQRKRFLDQVDQEQRKYEQQSTQAGA